MSLVPWPLLCSASSSTFSPWVGNGHVTSPSYFSFFHSLRTHVRSQGVIPMHLGSPPRQEVTSQSGPLQCGHRFGLLKERVVRPEAAELARVPMDFDVRRHRSGDRCPAVAVPPGRLRQGERRSCPAACFQLVKKTLSVSSRVTKNGPSPEGHVTCPSRRPLRSLS